MKTGTVVLAGNATEESPSVSSLLGQLQAHALASFPSLWIKSDHRDGRKPSRTFAPSWQQAVVHLRMS